MWKPFESRGSDKFGIFLTFHQIFIDAENPKKRVVARGIWPLTQELQLLSELHPLYRSKKWKMISERLREKGYQRTEIECRERWINFLDPQVKRGDWNEEELRQLYELHEEVGSRWSVAERAIGRYFDYHSALKTTSRTASTEHYATTFGSSWRASRRADKPSTAKSASSARTTSTTSIGARVVKIRLGRLRLPGERGQGGHLHDGVQSRQKQTCVGTPTEKGTLRQAEITHHAVLRAATEGHLRPY